jgi:hypothetical protein
MSPNRKIGWFTGPLRIVVFARTIDQGLSLPPQVCLERRAKEGDSPVREERRSQVIYVRPRVSRVAWECSPNMGDESHPRLNTGTSPIANEVP